MDYGTCLDNQKNKLAPNYMRHKRAKITDKSINSPNYITVNRRNLDLICNSLIRWRLQRDDTSQFSGEWGRGT